jgi:molybdopterin converting factor small subunit
MRIKVRPVGVIRKFVEEHEREAEEGLTSERLIRGLNIPRKLKMVSFVNGKREALNHALKDGDEVVLATLLSGG